MSKAKEYRISKDVLEDAVKLIEWSEDELYELLGQKLVAQESLKIPKKFEKTPGIKVKKFMYKGREAFIFDKEYFQKRGEAYLGKFRKNLFQKVCVEGQACKWKKEVLADAEKY